LKKDFITTIIGFQTNQHKKNGQLFSKKSNFVVKSNHHNLTILQMFALNFVLLL